MLELWEPSTMKLRSNCDTWELVRNRVHIPGFTDSYFKYCSPHSYKALPKTISQLKDMDP